MEVATIAGATGHVDTGLTNDTTYGYALAAVDTHGNCSADSAPVPATPTDLTAPAVPTGLAAVRGDGQVSLSLGPEPRARYRELPADPGTGWRGSPRCPARRAMSTWA